MCRIDSTRSAVKITEVTVKIPADKLEQVNKLLSESAAIEISPDKIKTENKKGYVPHIVGSVAGIGVSASVGGSATLMLAKHLGDKGLASNFGWGAVVSLVPAGFGAIAGTFANSSAEGAGYGAAAGLVSGAVQAAIIWKSPLAAVGFWSVRSRLRSRCRGSFL
jgi:hypothetical protein